MDKKANKKVLILEDNDLERMSLCVFLEDQQYTVIQSNNGKSGLSLFENDQPDIILTDLRMPELNGFDVVSSVSRDFPEIPIIVISATDSVGEAVEAIKLGAWDYITKPIQDMEVVEHSINKCFERVRLLKENKQYQEHLEEQVKTRTNELEKTNEKLREEIQTRKKMESELRESEERYRHLIEISPDMILIHNCDKILFVNPALVNFLGTGSSEELIGQSVLKLIHAFSREKAKKQWRKILNQEAINPIELKFVKLNSQIADVEALGRALNFRRTPAILSIYRDITKRKIVEESLLYRMALEKLITNISTHFINLRLDEIDTGINFALQQIGMFIEVDRSYIFQFSKNQKLMDNTHEWCAKGIESQISKLKNIVIDEEMPWFANKIKRMDPIYIPKVTELPLEAQKDIEHFQAKNIQSFVIVPIMYKNSIFGFLGLDAVKNSRTWSDNIIALLKIIGEIFTSALIRKKYEEEIKQYQEQLEKIIAERTRDLKESEKRYRSLYEGAPDAIFLTDPETGIIIDANPTAEKFLLKTRHDIIGSRQLELHSPENGNSNKKSFQIYSEDLEDKSLIIEDELVRDNGTTMPVEIKGQSIFLQGKKVFQGIYRDITPRKKAEKEKEQLENQLQRINTHIHNSVKNKLESLKLIFSQGKSFLPGSIEEAMNYFNMADSLISRLTVVSRNILFVLNHKNCNILDLMNELELQAELTLPVFNIAFSMNKTITDTTVLQPETVQYILDSYTDILNNIVRHSKASEVIINIEDSNEQFSLMIKDNGIGFNAKKTKEGAFGLKLIKQQTQLLGGKLLINSKPGHGTTIKINIACSPEIVE